jgi:hypothetical protein
MIGTKNFHGRNISPRRYTFSTISNMRNRPSPVVHVATIEANSYAKQGMYRNGRIQNLQIQRDYIVFSQIATYWSPNRKGVRNLALRNPLDLELSFALSPNRLSSSMHSRTLRSFDNSSGNWSCPYSLLWLFGQSNRSCSCRSRLGFRASFHSARSFDISWQAIDSTQWSVDLLLPQWYAIMVHNQWFHQIDRFRFSHLQVQ